jgi:large subunit ribosomal protein L21
MYAVIDDKGKQYKVELGEVLQVDLAGAEPGEWIEFERVLMVGGEDGQEPRIGRPLVEGALVRAEVIKHDKGRKVITLRYKGPHQTKKGHREKYTRVIIREIRPE